MLRAIGDQTVFWMILGTSTLMGVAFVIECVRTSLTVATLRWVGRWFPLAVMPILLGLMWVIAVWP